MVCPTVKWLQEFGDWCREHPWEYIPETLDCDDAALDAVVNASKGLKRNKKLWGNGHALLYSKVDMVYGETLCGITPVSNEAVRHANNVARTKEGWFFFERQTGQHEMVLSALERRAVDDLLFVLV